MNLTSIVQLFIIVLSEIVANRASDPMYWLIQLMSFVK